MFFFQFSWLPKWKWQRWWKTNFLTVLSGGSNPKE
jgi:hypothetical protein